MVYHQHEFSHAAPTDMPAQTSPNTANIDKEETACASACAPLINYYHGILFRMFQLDKQPQQQVQYGFFDEVPSLMH